MAIATSASAEHAAYAGPRESRRTRRCSCHCIVMAVVRTGLGIDGVCQRIAEETADLVGRER